MTHTAGPTQRSSLFITFEGGEGAGKSTQARLLAERLRETGRDVVLTREPGGTPLGQSIRELILARDGPPMTPLAELLLFNADRAQHLESVIRPALNRGAVVICDRFMDSTRAYQGAMGGVPSETVDAIEANVVGETRPTLTLLLDLPPETGLARVAARGAANRIDTEGLAFHWGLRAVFVAMAAQEPARIDLIDATQPELVIARAVWAAVEPRLSARTLR